MSPETAASAVWEAHGLVMNGGVRHCAETLSKRKLKVAIRGYLFFALLGAAEALSEALNLAPGAADEAEERLDMAYSAAIPNDRVLEEHVNRHFKEDNDVPVASGDSPIGAAVQAFISNSAEAVRLSTVAGKTRLQHRAFERAESAVRQLLRHWDAGGHQALVKLLEHNDEMVRVSAAAYLASSDPDRAIPVLEELGSRETPASVTAHGTLFAIQHGTFSDPLKRLQSTL